MAKSISIDKLGETLTKTLGKIDEAILMKSEKAIRATFIETAQEIIIKTPVDTGRARANWFVTRKTPSRKTTSSKNSNGAMAKAQKAFSGNVLGDTFFIANNLPYIGMLEFGGYLQNPKKGSRIKKGARKGSFEKRSKGGFSKQAPNGMVRITLDKFDNRLKKNIKRYSK